MNLTTSSNITLELSDSGQAVVDDDTSLVDINHVDNARRNALFYTAAGGRADTLVHLIQQGSDVTTDEHQFTLLMEAVHYDQM